MSDTVILIPTYNNAGTLADVVHRSLQQGLPVLVVDDGSTDDTPAILAALSAQNPGLHRLRQEKNRGKGAALKRGFQEAKRQGYRYALTLDADGQHFPEDIPALMARKGERTLAVGSRNIRGNSRGSSFANRFSNFWFRLYTGCALPDTQTGYRLYPLGQLPGLWLLSSRYEAELTLLVFSAWKGLDLQPVPVRVAYPEHRVSHFHPVKDFTRISLLNTVLLFVAIFYGWPRLFLHRLSK